VIDVYPLLTEILELPKTGLIDGDPELLPGLYLPSTKSTTTAK